MKKIDAMQTGKRKTSQSFYLILLLFAGLFTQAQPQLPVAIELPGFPDAKIYYPFENDALDYSGNANHLSINKAHPGNGKHDNLYGAYEFRVDSFSYMVSYGGYKWLTSGEFTINMWVKGTNPGGLFFSTLLSQADTVGDDLMVGISNNHFYFLKTATEMGEMWIANDSLNSNQWYMLTASVKIDTSVHVNLYINGSESGWYNDTNYSIYQQGVPLMTAVGASDDYGNNAFDGFIDDIKVFETLLDASQINDLYNYESLNTRDVTFNVDMRYQIGMGYFDPGTDFVDIPGSFNSWSGQILDDVDGDSIYSTVISGLVIGDSVSYKFRFNGDWAQPHDFPNGSNRLYGIGDKINSVQNVFNDESYLTNLGVISVVTPLPSASGNSELVTIDLQNAGYNPITSASVSYQLDGGATVTETYNGTLEFGAVTSYSFANTIDVSAEGTHTLKVFVALDGDENHDNDTLTYFIYNLPVVASLPYAQDFELPDNGWYTGGINSTWERGLPAKTSINSVASGSNAMVTSLSNTVQAGEQSYVVSPVFQGPFSNTAVSFSYLSQTNWQAGAALQYSTDGGNTWLRLADNNTIFNGNEDDVYALAWTGDLAGIRGSFKNWQTVHYPMGNLGGASEVMFRMVFGSEATLDMVFDGFAFDDFKFYELPQYDLSLRFAKVDFTLDAAGNEYVGVNVQNLGQQTLYSYHVEAHLNNAEVFTNDIYDAAIDPNGENWTGVNINVSNLPDGPYTLTVIAYADGDENAGNDTLYITGVKAASVSTYPYTDDFEGLQQWVLHNDDMRKDPVLEIGSPYGAIVYGPNSGSNALATNVSGDGGFRTTVAATSRWFNFSGVFRPTLNFALLRDFSESSLVLGIQYRTRTTDWVQLGYNDYSDWYNQYLDGTYGVYYRNQMEGWANFTDSAWITIEKTFEELAGMDEVQFRFLYSVGDNWTKAEGFAMDDFMVYDNRYSSDLALVKIISPLTGLPNPSNDTIKVLLENRGLTAAYGFSINVSLDTAYFTETFNDTIQPGESYIAVFTQTYDFSALGDYYIDLSLSYGLDMNYNNDYSYSYIYIQQLIGTFPYYEDFEADEGGWITPSNLYFNSWVWGPPSGTTITSAASGLNAYATLMPQGKYEAQEFAVLQSPIFDFSSLSQPKVSLDIWSQTNDFDDGAVLQYSIDKGASWQTVGIQGPVPNWYNWTSDASQGGLAQYGILQYWTSEMFGWHSVSHPVPELAGQSEVSFRILFASDDADNFYDGFAIDNFGIAEMNPGLTENFNDNSLTGWNAPAMYALTETNQELMVSGVSKTGWESFTYNFEPLTVSNNPKLAVRLKADTTLTVRFCFIDANGMWSDGANTGFHVPADGVYHSYYIDFTDKLFNYQGIPLDPNKIIGVGVTVNQEGNFSNTFYLDDLKMGDDAVLSNNLKLDWLVIGNECNPSATMPIEIQVVNTGQGMLTDFDITVSIDSIEIANETYSGTLNAGDTLYYALTTKADLTTSEYRKTYQIFAKISQASDENLADDSYSFSKVVFGNYVDQPQWKSYNTCNGLADNNVWAIDEDVNGTIWMSGFYGVTRFDGNTFTQFHIADGLVSDYTWNIHAATDGTVWFPATTGGFAAYKNGVFTQYFPFDSLIFEECSFEDTLGNMWFGSYNNNGVAMFNGTTWTHYPTEFGDIIEAIGYAPNGNLLFANHGSIAEYDGTNITEFLVDGTVMYANEIFRDSKNTTWLYGNNLLKNYDGTAFTDYSTAVASIGYIQAIEEDNKGNIWFGGANGVAKFDGLLWELFTSAEGLIPSATWSLAASQNGSVWIGTRLGASVYTPKSDLDLQMFGQIVPKYVCADSLFYLTVQVVNTGLQTITTPDFAYVVDGGAPVVETYNADILAGDTLSFTFAKPLNLYTTNYNQVFSLLTYIQATGDQVSANDSLTRNINVFGDYADQMGWESYNTCNGLVDPNVWSMVQDKDNKVWLTTFFGIQKFDGPAITTYTVADGLLNNYSWTSLAASDGSLWFPSVSGGFTRYSNGIFEQINPFDNLIFAECSFEDSKGNLWFGSYEGHGVAMFNGTTWTHYPTEAGTVVVAINEDANGHILFGNYDKTFAYNGTSFSEFLINGTTKGANEIFTDTKKQTWFFGNGELWRIDSTGNVWTDFSNNMSLIGHVEAINEDSYKTLWFGGQSGATSFDGTTWKTYTQGNGLVPGAIYSILANTDGSIWFGSYKTGLSIFLNRVLAKYDYTVVDQTVSFSNKSYANSPAYNWNFGDGTQSQLVNPVHTYAAPGYYEACLTVFDVVSGQSSDFCSEIMVGDSSQICKAEFSYGQMQDTVFFTNTSVNNFTNYSWNFGDGQFSSEENPVHIYNQGGYYQVSLSAYDSISLCYDEVSYEIYLDFDGSALCKAEFKSLINSATATFINTSSGSATDVLWNFGDNTYSTLTDTVNHTYANSGFYTVCIAVYDSISGCMDEYCNEIQVNIAGEAVCNADYSYFIQGSTVNFTQKAQGSVTNYMWDFADGTYGFDANPKHTYSQPGFYKVELTIYDSVSNCMDDVTKVIVVTEGAALACQASFTNFVDENKVVFSNTSTGNYTDVFWDFGDGSYSTDTDPEHSYAKPDFYEVFLTIYDSESDCLNEFSKVIQISSEGTPVCDAKFTYFGDNNELSFTNKSEGELSDYFWDFGDGHYSFDENPTHVFEESGYFEVILTVFNSSNNCIDDKTKVVFVYNPDQEACNAQFSFYPEGNDVYFTSEATGAYAQHFWDFDDGTNSNQENPMHTYTKPGYYEVTYVIIDTTTACFDSRSKIIFVQGSDAGAPIVDLKAKFSYVPSNQSNQVTFNDESLGSITNWYWDFGDNKPASNLQNPVYTYDMNDYYRVCLTVNNANKQKTNCKFIAVGDVSNSSTAFFTYFADTVTATAYFKNKSLGNILNYYWDFGDGFTSEQKSPTHTYADTGYYAVCLTTVSASGVSKTYCNDVRIGNTLANPCLFSCVWPGDANNDLEANHYDIMTIGLNYGLQGPKREDATTVWYGQYAQNWSTFQLDGTNNKYGDCNGDGVINLDDVSAIEQNFAYSHFWQPDVKNADWVITCQWLDEDLKAAGSRSRAKAILSPPFKAAGDIYAIAYEIEVIGGEKIIWDSLQITFDNSWIGEDGVSMLTVSEIDSVAHMIYIGNTRIDQQNINGTGEIAELKFVFKQGYNASGVSLNVSTQGGIVSSGEPVTVDGSIVLDLTSPIEICEGETALLDAGSGFDTYEWSTGISDTNQIVVNTSGIYFVTVTDGNGASATDSIEVIVYPRPEIDLGADVSAANNTVLDAGDSFFEYLWSTGETTQTITVTETGEYWVQVFNQKGCMSADTINVTITTGINDSDINNLTVYPNPNNGKFWLVYEFNTTTSSVVDILNIEGNTVWRNEVVDFNGHHYLIDADELAKGVYYVRVISGDKVGTIRFVVL